MFLFRVTVLSGREGTERARVPISEPALIPLSMSYFCVTVIIHAVKTGISVIAFVVTYTSGQFCDKCQKGIILRVEQ